VALKKRLPQDLVATVFSNQGLIESGERNVVRFRYISDAIASSSIAAAENDETEGSSTSAIWKSSILHMDPYRRLVIG
jgi:hypothetical protein